MAESTVCGFILIEFVNSLAKSCSISRKIKSYNEIDHDEPNNILGRFADRDTCHFRGDFLHTVSELAKQSKLISEQMSLHDLIAHLFEKSQHA